MATEGHNPASDDDIGSLVGRRMLTIPWALGASSWLGADVRCWRKL
jgi:hypothetical protein